MLQHRITASLAALVVGLVSAIAAGDDSQPQLRITRQRDTDKAEITAEQDKSVFLIHSPVGISSAVIDRTGEQWPEGVVLRLHLKGLESLRASNGKVTLNAAVSSHDQRQRMWKDDKENAPLDSQSPFWMQIRRVGGDGKPAKDIPLRTGYFEMQLPRVFFEGNPQSITINWIDFYRN